VNVLDLFSGIGGFSLGLERAGMRTVAFCEIDPYARKVLRKHWPYVPQFEDVRDLTANALSLYGIGPIDVICGGFPCQDISNAGKKAGLAGERSGLWSEIARLVGELRPRYVIVENVAALLSRGLGDVLGDLAEIGYDAEWHCIPASAVGAPHRRDRIWIVAYPSGAGLEGLRSAIRVPEEVAGAGGAGETMAHAESRAGRVQKPQGLRQDGQVRIPIPVQLRDGGWLGQPGTDWWEIEPDVDRVADGVPDRVDRLRCLGNAVVPQIPELIGRAIMAAADSGSAVEGE
jgi:DNA (cytosine-5)-methyltransferase 1